MNSESFAEKLKKAITKKSALKCNFCGSTKLRKIGTQLSVSGKYQRYQCTKCGHTLKGEVVESFKK